MIQWLIYEQFGVEYSVFYIPQLLKNMGFSYQKAKFVGRCQGSCRIFYKFLSSIISKNIVLWLTSLVESSSTSHPANFSLVPPGR